MNKWFNQFRVGVWPSILRTFSSLIKEALNQYFVEMTPNTGPFDITSFLMRCPPSDKSGPAILHHSGRWTVLVHGDENNKVAPLSPSSSWQQLCLPEKNSQPLCQARSTH